MRKFCSVNLGIRKNLSWALSFLSLTFIFIGNAWALDTLCIPNHEGLPFAGSLPPTIDGYIGKTEVDAAGDPAFEQGWVRSALLSYFGGGSDAYAETRVIKDNAGPFMYLSFLVRHDLSFDADDSVVIVLDPGWTTSPPSFTNQARRLIISPVLEGVGASGVVGVGTDLVRQNRAPDVDWGKYTGASWTNMAAIPTGAAVKVRSWQMNGSATDVGWSIEIKLPLNTATGGSEWTNLAGGFGYYSNMIKVCSTASCAPVPVDGYLATEYAWPRITSYTPGAPGLIADPMLTYGTLKALIDAKISASWLGQAQFASATTSCHGVRFVGGPAGIGVLSADGSLGSTVEGNGTTNTLVARLANDGAASDGKGVRVQFKMANWGVGGANATWAPVTARPAGSIPASLSGITPLNASTPNTNASARVDIPAGSSSNDVWMQTTLTAADGYCDPSVNPSCPAGSKWSHQCILAELDSNQNATFSDSSVHRNFDIVHLSSQRRTAEISAKGWGAPVESGGPQHFLLTTSEYVLYRPAAGDRGQIADMPKGISRKLMVSELKGLAVPKKFAKVPGADARMKEMALQLLTPPLERELMKTPGPKDQPLWNYVWMVDVNRATPLTMNIGKKKYRIYEPAGTFGRVGQHFGKVERLAHEMSGGEAFKKAAVGPRLLTVRNESVERLDTLIEAVEKIKPLRKGPEIRLPTNRVLPGDRINPELKIVPPGVVVQPKQIIR